MDHIDKEIILGLIGLAIILMMGYVLGYALGLEVFIN